MITFNYPYWYILLCVLLGIGYALLLYRKDKTFGEEYKFLPQVLGALRFLSVTLLALLLLEPLVQSEEQIIEKPIIVIAQDNSESIKLSKDSLFYKTTYKENLKQLKTKLAEKFSVETLSFGSTVTDSLAFDYTKKQTDISSLFEAVENKYYGRNLGSVIIASDGIINKGINPEYSAKNLENTVIFSIAMGDTNIRKDVIINSIHNNEIAFKGNDFPVEIDVKGNYLSNKSVSVSVWKKGKKIDEKPITFDSDNSVKSASFILPALNSGKQRYSVKVTELKEELTYINNVKDFYINVIENKQNILVLADAPHPDIAVLKEVLLKNKNYTLDVKLINEFKSNIEKYSLVILHGIPNSQQSNNRILDNLIKSKTPLLICATEHTNFNKINQLKKKLTINGHNGYSSAKGSLNPSFNKFTISSELRSDLNDYPPLQVPFASGYKVAQKNNILLTQKINGTKTNYPLMVFNENDGQKVGFLLGEGIWRWKLLDYLKNDNNSNFEELVQKSIQFLVAKKDKSQFRIFNKELILENETLVIDAELYNESYELINDSEIEIKIVNEEGEEYPSKTMSKAGNGYRLDVGKFKSGEYTYFATTNFDGKVYEKTGKFSVKELKVEFVNLVANHKLLNNLAVSKNGKLFYPNQLKELEEEIYNQDNIVPVSFIKKSVEDVIKWKWIFGIIILLLSIEWFLRKRSGGY